MPSSDPLEAQHRTMKPPTDLAPAGRGRRFWRSVVRDHELAPVELELLAEACHVMDRLEQLRGPATADPRLLVEERQQVVVLSRLLGQLALPVPDDERGIRELATGTSVRGRRAAAARWSRRRAGVADGP